VSDEPRNPALLVPPGSSGVVELGGGVTAHVVRGARPGPIVWAWVPMGLSDPSQVQALGELRDRLVPDELVGAVGLLLQGPAIPPAREAYRDAAAVRAVCHEAAALVILETAAPGFLTLPHVELDVGDANARRVARALGARFAVPMPAPINRAIVTAPTVTWIDGEQERLARPVIDRVAASLGSLLGTLGMTSDPPLRPELRVVLKSVATVDAWGDGLMEAVVMPGDIVDKGQAIAYVGPPGTRARRTLRAPVSGVVLWVSAEQRIGLAGEVGIGRLSRALGKLKKKARHDHEALGAGDGGGEILDLGWCEHVALPELGLKLRAKIDTGARSCALHVTSLHEVAFDDDGNVLMDVQLADETGRTRATRVAVVEYAHVKDSGGHTERRPVIETLLALGDRVERVRVTLTDRGDMRFPMLVGRTALTAAARVHPSRRYLLGR
jgi:hypothetical protein